MVFVYFGKDSGLTLHLLKKDMKLKGESYEQSIVYDCYRDPVQDFLSDCTALSLFGEKKAIVAANCYFLASLGKTVKGPVKEKEQDYKGLLEYIQNPNEDTDLYLLVPGSLNPTGDLVKALKKSGAAFKDCLGLKEDDYYMMAYNRAKEEKKKISKGAIAVLLSRTNGDFLLFSSYLDLLLTYKDDVQEEDASLMVYKPVEDKAYECLSFLLKGDVRSALTSYRNVRRQGVDGLVVLLTFVTQIRLMALVAALSEEGESNDSIAKALSQKGSPIKPGRIYYMKKDIQFLTFDRLVSILADLGAIEENVKLDGDDVDERMELFILRFPDYRKRR